MLRVPEVLQTFLLHVLRSSQVCSNRHINCCSSEADNEALTNYLREARFIRCAQTMPSTDSIKTTLTLLTPAYIRTFKDQTPVPVQANTFAYCFPEVSQMSTQCLSEMNHIYKCSVNSLYWQWRAICSSVEHPNCPVPVWGILGAHVRMDQVPANFIIPKLYVYSKAVGTWILSRIQMVASCSSAESSAFSLW